MHEPIYREALARGLDEWALELPEPVQQRLCRYLALLFEKNKVMNLTAVTEPGEMVRRHLLDSLAPIKLGLLEGPCALADIGTGAGLPGLPLALARPQDSVLLIDSLQKRIAFLEEVLQALPAPNAAACLGRAEELFHAPALREGFDVVTARAVAELRRLAEYCLPALRVGGLFLPFKSAGVEQELEEARNAIGTLGGKLERVLVYRVPGEPAERLLPVIRKVRGTDAKYPRRQSQIKKNPL
ncbi:MAG: 16S rRNA (guanine(527)-N(7))-methyltransferase RsmG [Clostridiales bacterium]|nr:16S rRNA (guanine(527)-N(7))-methyltransferase RsmG [Clostridiales bacterium]